MHKILEFIKQNRKWNTALWVGIALFLIVSLVSIDQKESDLKIQQISVDILPESELSFLDSAAILDIMKSSDAEMMLTGNKLGHLKIDEMEAALENNPFVEEADIAVDLAGNMRVKVLQRSPVLRVFNNRGQSYYVAKNGYKIPMSKLYTARVMVANGNIPESLTDSSFAKTQLLKDLHKIALYCSRDKFWESQIEQLYVDNYNDILLIPIVGNHSIVFGSGENIEDKFTRLRSFYFNGLNNIGWNKYRSVNLKYDNQVVAERSGTQITAPDTTR